MGIRDERIAKGQCPDCGKESAPYYLCYSCRQKTRLYRALQKGERIGALRKDLLNRYYLGDPSKNEQWQKWGTAFHLPDTDGRAKPRLRGIRIDVEETLLRVIEYIGRPCTIDEILTAWGKLRSKRTDPLPNDLARIIVAQDKRSKKMAKRAAATQHQHS